MTGGILKRTGLMASLFLAALLLASCSKNTQIIDKLAMVQTAGYDLKDDKVNSSVLLGEYTEKDKTNISFLQTTSNNSYDMMTRLNTQMNKPIAYGQMRMIIIGQSFARKGVGEVLNIMSRDVTVSRHLQLAVSSDKDKAEDIMRATIGTHDPLYLPKMVEQNFMTGNLPSVNLHRHIYTYFGEGQDLYMPTFTIVQNNKVDIDGIAIFKNDKVVYQLPIDDCIWFKVLMENAKNGTFLMQRKDKGDVLITIDSSKNKMKYNPNNPNSMQNKIKIRASIKNISENISYSTKNQLEALEKELQAYSQERLIKVMNKFQTLKVDPVGYGNFARSRDPKWNEKQFYSQYENQMKLQLDVEFKLSQTGVKE